MTEDPEASNSQRHALADAFDTERDPLAEHAATFSTVDVDPFALFQTNILVQQNLAADTIGEYERLITHWREYMALLGRHPACPNVAHVESFAEYCQERRENQPDTVRTKLRRLNRIYEYWQRDPVFPHESGCNPFTLVLSKLDLARPPTKEPPRISSDALARIVQSITHVRNRAIVVAQFKLGLRATELCTLRLADLHLAAPELHRGYPDLGTNPALRDRRNTVYIPSRYGRQGNTSHRARLLPLDDELRVALRDYLLARPDPDDDAAFLTLSTHNPLDNKYVNRVWTTAFHPAYAETEHHRAVTSHFGRHRFSPYWHVKQGLSRELVKYMRGDTIDEESHLGRHSMTISTHTTRTSNPSTGIGSISLISEQPFPGTDERVDHSGLVNQGAPARTRWGIWQRGARG